MSLVPSMMAMRATTKRNESGTDPDGGKKTDGWVMVADAVPCYVWVKSSREVIEAKSVVVEDIKGYFRHDADLKRGDRIVILQDRRGRSIILSDDGEVLEVDTVTVRTVGASPSHLEVRLRRAYGC